MTVTIAEVIRQIERAGGRLVLDGERVRYRLPRSFQEPKALLATLRSNRQEVVRLLRERDGESLALCGSPRCAGCYSVGDGKKIHPPKASREWLEWLKRWEPKGAAQ